MATGNTAIKEEFVSPAVQDMSGGGAHLPDTAASGAAVLPTGPGDTTGVDTVKVPGVGEVSHAQLLQAILRNFAGLDKEALERIVDTLNLDKDYNVTPLPANIDDTTATSNLASISVKEDVAEMLAGQENLTEEFKQKTEVIFEAAVGARVAVLEAQLKEQSETQIAEAVEELTESIVEKLDKYITYAAEQYVENNKAVLEQTLRHTVSESFMSDVIGLAGKYNITISENELDVVEQVNTRNEELEKKLTESLDAQIAITERADNLEKQLKLKELSEGLTATQADRLKILAENTTVESLEDYISKVEVLRESVAQNTTKVESVITEQKVDGVPNIDDVPPPAKTEMTSYTDVMRRVFG